MEDAVKKAPQNDMIVEIQHDLAGTHALSMVYEMDKVPVHRVDRIILSFAKVRRIDATGLAMLVRLYSQLISRGKQLLLTQLTQQVRTLLEQIGFSGVLETIPMLQPTPEPSWRLVTSPAVTEN